MFLVVKASTIEEAKKFTLNRGLSVVAATMVGSENVGVDVVDDEKLKTDILISNWFAEESGNAYYRPHGTLLWFKNS